MPDSLQFLIVLIILARGVNLPLIFNYLILKKGKKSSPWVYHLRLGVKGCSFRRSCLEGVVQLEKRMGVSPAPANCEFWFSLPPSTIIHYRRPWEFAIFKHSLLDASITKMGEKNEIVKLICNLYFNLMFSRQKSETEETHYKKENIIYLD